MTTETAAACGCPSELDHDTAWSSRAYCMKLDSYNDDRFDKIALALFCQLCRGGNHGIETADCRCACHAAKGDA